MAAQGSPGGSAWVMRHVAASIVLIVAIVAVIVAGFQAILAPFLIWIFLLALFVALTLVVSHNFTRRWLGVLIDDRNKFSLSRLQMLLWTAIVLSAFLASVLANIQLTLLVYVSGAVDQPQVFYEHSGALVSDVLWHAGILNLDPETGSFSAAPDVDLSQINLAQPLQDGQVVYVPRPGETIPAQVAVQAQADQKSGPSSPLAVQIPSEVWLLLGVSTTSLVASPLIKGQKSDVIVKNQSAVQASLGDLFKGEEIGNFGQLDLAKVQLLYFTLIVIGAYMIAVANQFLNTQTAIASLPALDGGVVAMLGVSHAGYLSNKAVGHSSSAMPTVTADTTPPAPPTDDQGGVG